MAGAGMTSQFMSAMMSSMLILAAPAFFVVTGIAVLVYRRWKRDDED
jgi:hypothetical protein